MSSGFPPAEGPGRLCVNMLIGARPEFEGSAGFPQGAPRLAWVEPRAVLWGEGKGRPLQMERKVPQSHVLRLCLAPSLRVGYRKPCTRAVKRNPVALGL